MTVRMPKAFPFSRALCRILRPARPVLAIVVISASGCGLGAAVLAAVHELWVKAPIGVQSADSLVIVNAARNYLQFERLRQQSVSLDVAAYTRANELSVDASPTTVSVECVSREYFTVLGATAFRGRLFGTDGDSSADDAGVVLGHGLWTRQFAQSEQALQRRLSIGGKPLQVVGIAEAGFTGAGLNRVDAWITINGSPDRCSFTGSDLRGSAGAWLIVAGRLRNGMTRPHAESEARALLAETGRGMTASTDIGRPQLTPLSVARRAEMGSVNQVIGWSAAACAGLLGLTILNALCLLALHLSTRRQEIVIRVCLGATPSQIARQLIVEHLTILIQIALVAVPASILAIALLRSVLPVLSLSGARASAWAFLLAVTTGGAMLIGHAVWFVLANTRHPLQWCRAPHEWSSVRSSTGRGTMTLHTALAVPLSLCAMLFMRSADAAQTGLGFDAARTIVVTASATTSDADAAAVFNALVPRIERLPTVEGVSAASFAMLDRRQRVQVVPIKVPSSDETLMVPLNAVEPRYFGVVGTRLQGGRTFNGDDRMGSEPVTVLSAAVAGRLGGADHVVGTCVSIANVPCVRVIGVSQDRRSLSISRTADEAFVPLAQMRRFANSPASRVVIVRVRGEQAGAIALAVDMTRSLVESQLPSGGTSAFRVSTVASLLDEQTQSWRAGLALFGLIALLAVGLVAAGAYSVLSAGIESEMRDHVVRLALGATPLTLTCLVLRRWARVTTVGVIAGLAVGYVLVRWLGSLWFGTVVQDAGAWLASASTVVLASLLSVAVSTSGLRRVSASGQLRHS